MIVYITRHGQPQLSPRQEDPPLTPLGRIQARRLGERLRALGFQGTIYASPYRRTVETAVMIAEVLQTTFYPEAALREVVKDAAKMIGFRGMALSEIAAFSRLASDAQLPYPWWTGEEETPERVLGRVRPFLARLAERADDHAGGDVLLVGHGASVAASLRYYLEPYPEWVAKRGPNWNCALTAIRVAPVLEPLLITDVAHLESDQVTSNNTTLDMWKRQQVSADEGWE